MQFPRIKLQEFLVIASNKVKTLTETAESLHLKDEKIDRFIAVGMLDFFLTQIKPYELAEYYEARKKGKIY